MSRRRRRAVARAWAALMRRAFDIDVLACPRCGGRLRLVATVEDPDALGRSWPPSRGRAIWRSERRPSLRGPTLTTPLRSAPDPRPDAADAEACVLGPGATQRPGQAGPDVFRNSSGIGLTGPLSAL
jgi:hypothetical protein